MPTRQPIVSVLGHVDHGKTTLLDQIRGTAVVKKEAGAITQHIGATEVPIEHIYAVCKQMIGSKKFDMPGLLFIDTPGHQSFTSLRARGGSLADLAVLVIDINEGIMPQTLESISILKRFKTPFIIAVNKVDLIEDWTVNKDEPFALNVRKQSDKAAASFDDKFYKIIGELYEHGYTADRYDRIEDFTKSIAIVPISAKNGIGLPDLLLMLIGLAQRFLEDTLEKEEGPAKGVILEVKEERGLGQTVDVIIYAGTLKKGDTVILGTKGKPLVTKVKAILKPKPLDEIRDPKDRFDSVKEVSAAIGVKLMCQSLEGVVSGGPLRAAGANPDEARDEVSNETKVNIELKDDGIYIKADALGSLEALAYECNKAGIPIRKYDTGLISRKDLIDASAYGESVHRVIMGFNVGLLPDAKDAQPSYPNLKVFTSDVVYRLIEEYTEWMEEEKRRLDEEKRSEFAFPGKVRLLPNCVFRASKPAIVGVRVLGGRIRPGQSLIDIGGNTVGKIRSIRDGEESIKEAIQGDEKAVAIDGPTVGRQINEEDILYVDLRETSIKEMEKMDITEDDRMVIEELKEIKRKTDKFWGM
ncbi:translation initiation factor IF-2 [Candidatus Methanomassiliicoccus intestinalis]|jgi:translation initiation factor aIF-2|uniref:Probable translation initiation factor IF-2 n=2 Tax=Candidatus Methanomassiliicoccus intestinalis TaxID=1406512 RepID=R9T8A9_METII|nr:translation initiation factor IF-2 [Candidatus Methanomassiliicoccus intestinalis]AGN27142.1 translation initiation factor IF-2 [Candidatus Methanomassiliicoccus intestinalis Issoire-Mx1]TQS81405.1 MAG: translation initiation factor IF-2 [Candidatus Methanomassiliicoccus intestinalis]TQS84399.1 MAG: translation initiation factor IF-2 [Candidatus Methanomassiliicoccus intestinalis]